MPESLCKCNDKERNVKIKVATYCGECSSVMEKFTIQRPLKAIGLSLLVAYGGSHFIDYAISDNRYPLSVETEIFDSCLNSYEKPLNHNDYRNKKSVCICALQDTMNEISFMRYSVDENGFSSAFLNNINRCK
ncbi:hypothetical protein C9J19_20280 [Photobacterium phosphoreum]|uniref:hypothetical protein n=1 Tax=Photobacterium phosphoreum TaxID=659 RepID=UPI000D177D33|nr:hypothetical protein [Photobacterium phosphoreum]PSW24302.1 hypothetical protein C9J19_20280 [Photobacterium phosphoreum]